MKIIFIIGGFLLFFFTGNTQSVCSTIPVMPIISEAAKKEMEQRLTEARAVYENNKSDANALIWYGRRTAYLGRYAEAITIFSDGIALHPQDARLYRHRGHRYITLRCFDKAIDDLLKATALSKNKPDETEPDGMPNEKNIPTSTLQSNSWYHLGLAYYLKGKFTEAAAAYKKCLAISNNPDMYVATANWLYITLRRLKKEKEAAKLLSTISAGMNLIENKDYLRLLLLYKQEADPELLKQELFNNGSSLSNASIGFGLGNYYLLNRSIKDAKVIFEKIVAGDQWASFGFIAAEAELRNLK